MLHLFFGNCSSTCSSLASVTWFGFWHCFNSKSPFHYWDLAWIARIHVSNYRSPLNYFLSTGNFVNDLQLLARKTTFAFCLSIVFLFRNILVARYLAGNWYWLVTERFRCAKNTKKISLNFLIALLPGCLRLEFVIMLEFDGWAKLKALVTGKYRWDCAWTKVTLF